MSPVFLRAGRYAFFCFAADLVEPAHVQVRGGCSGVAKFWLIDAVELAGPGPYNAIELRAIRRRIVEHLDDLKAAWNEFHRSITDTP